MGAQVSVLPGTTLAAALAISDVTLTVTDASSAALNFVDDNNLRVIGKQSAVCNAQVPPLDITADETVTSTEAAGVISGLDNWTVDGGGATAASTVAALAGSVVINADGTALTENTDFVVDYQAGAIRFNSNATVDAAAGNTYGFVYQYRRFDAVEVYLGKFKPVLEVSVRLEHTFPDGRTLSYTAPRAMIKPENPTLSFTDDDWIGAEMEIEILQSNDPQDVDAPFGKFRIETKNGVSLEGYNPDTYSSGIFTLYLTPLDAGVAGVHGLTGAEIDVGNVAVGDIQANREFLKHYRGIPKQTDKVIEIQKEMSLNATIENMNPTNFSLLFEGERAEDITGATWQTEAVLLTIPDLSGATDYVSDWYSVPQLKLNPA